MASVFSSSWASLPIHTNTCGEIGQLLVAVSRRLASLSSETQSTDDSALPVPRCPGSWHHLWPGRLVSSLQVPPQSEQRHWNVNTSLQICCLCKKWQPWKGLSVTAHKWSWKKQNELAACGTYNEVACLVGAGKESGWVGVHLVLQTGGGAILSLASQRLPEIIYTSQAQEVSHYCNI